MEAAEEGIVREVRDAPPAHMLIEIQSFSKFSKQESREFAAGNHRWRLAIVPNEGGDISLYLCVAEAEIDTLDVPVHANCSILLHNQISEKYLCYRSKDSFKFDAVNWKWGFSISKSTLSEGYLVDDTLVFGAEVFVTETINQRLSLFDFKISDFSKIKQIWCSHVLRVGGIRWMLKVYPNGYDQSAMGQHVSVFLQCVDAQKFAPDEQVKVNFCICLRNNLPHHSPRCRSGSRCFKAREASTFGFFTFISLADMRDPTKGFIVNDTCFMDLQIYVEDVVYTPKLMPLFN